MKDQSKQDDIYATRRDSVSGFVFDEQVAHVFEDMIRRSVPGYGTVIKMSSVLAAQYATRGSRCYDLGCSLGATTHALVKGIQEPGCQIVAVDNSEAMIREAKNAIKGVELITPIEWICSDIREIPIENASIVTLNFTLQFIPIEERKQLLEKIRKGLNSGGILILSEKIAFDDEELESLQMEMHHAFKRANGYNDLEISQKRSALENVLIPETLPAHQERLKQAGFKRADLWFQCFNFVSIVARV